MKNFSKLFENGRTMIEMLAVLAIIAVIGIGISAGISHGLDVYRASVIKTQLPQIAKAVETYYSFYPGSDISHYDLFEDILGSGACPRDDNTYESGGCTTAAGPMYVEPITGTADFSIIFTKMPKKICQELADSARGDGNLGFKGLRMETDCSSDTVKFTTKESEDPAPLE